MRFPARPLAAIVALSLAAPAFAQAQQAAEPSSPDVVVTGTREGREQVRDFVGALTPARSGSIPRFIDRVCPYVAGLRPAQNQAVAERLRLIARDVGLDIAEGDCVPNAFVIVTADKRAFLDGLRRRQPAAFATLSARQVRRLVDAPGPVAAWQLEGPVDADGIPLPWDDQLGAYRNDTIRTSRLTSSGGRAFDAAALVVESRALEGLTWIQLADYAAMRLFAQLDPARLTGTPPPTILTALTAPMGSAVPITMTSWDLGFLRGLYWSRMDLHPSSQRGEIVRRVRRDLEGR